MMGLLVTPLKDEENSSPGAAREGAHVRTEDLARVIEEWLACDEQRNYHHLAERAGVSPRAVSKVLRRERPFQTVHLADRLLLAMDRSLAELEIIDKDASR